VRRFLVGAAAGAALASGAFFISSAVGISDGQAATKPQLLVVTYTKPDGPFANSTFQGISDPAPGKQPSEYLVEVAHRCRLNNYKLESNSNSTDLNSAARFYVRLTDVSDDSFNCLTGFVRQAYFRLEKSYELCGEGTTSDRYFTLGVYPQISAESSCLRGQE
jgi:hypothetical protein